MSLRIDHETAPLEARLLPLLEEKLELRRGDFATLARKALPRLPRLLRGDLRRILAAREMEGSKRLAQQIDGPELVRCADRLVTHLKALDPVDARRGRWLGMLGGLMFNLLLLFALVIVVLRWRGIV